MKLFLVTIVLATGMFSLIMMIDLLMGIVRRGIIWKALNPFRVMETAEYIIILLFVLFFIFTLIGSYLKKKQKDNQPAN
ncbi:hypothetical protein [Neobacillus sp. NPDC093127]|uniref:hypothetical protein n=1 Tax=Neobacillus sp. NPDC093127 TaxID=3364296 RepID=UPI0037F1B368